MNKNKNNIPMVIILTIIFAVIIVLALYFNGVFGLPKGKGEENINTEQVTDTIVDTTKKTKAEGEGVFIPNAFPYKFTTENAYGETITDENLSGKEIFFVHLWATWCDPCINEMPEFASLVEEYGDKVGFIGLVDDFSDNKKGVKDTLEKSGVPNSFVMVDAYLDGFSKLRKDLDSGYFPTTIIIDSEGNLLGDPIIGAKGDKYGEYLRQQLED